MERNIINGRLAIDDNERQDSSLKILFTGDLCPLNRTEKLIKEGKSNEIISSILPVLEDKDIMISNLEAPITTADTTIKKSGPNLKLDPSCLEFLNTAQIDVACLANNHIGDYGTEPVKETIDILNRHNINSVGAGANIEDAWKPLLIEKRGRE